MQFSAWGDHKGCIRQGSIKRARSTMMDDDDPIKDAAETAFYGPDGVLGRRTCRLCVLPWVRMCHLRRSWKSRWWWCVEGEENVEGWRVGNGVLMWALEEMCSLFMVLSLMVVFNDWFIRGRWVFSVAAQYVLHFRKYHMRYELKTGSRMTTHFKIEVIWVNRIKIMKFCHVSYIKSTK